MAKEKFNWKGLFIQDEDGQTDDKSEIKETKPSSSTTSFPDTPQKFTKPAVATNQIVNNDILSTIIDMYETGFESLNKPGYDFYEFFKAIKAVGSNNASIYKMAMSMATGVDSKVSKDSLLTEADFYVKEIEKVHKQYHQQGTSKKSQLQNTQKSGKDNLTSEISKLEQQLLDIQNKISQKKTELQSIDSNLLTDIAEIEQKIVANDIAKSKILETITTVIDGIKTNL